MLAGLTTGAGVLAIDSGEAQAEAGVTLTSPASRVTGWLDVKEDFNARGDGIADDTHALQTAISAGSASVRPIRLPPGVYRITEPLTLPPNTMLVGSAPGLGFGCRIEPDSCPALVIGGKSPSFHCSIENLMIWPKHAAPDFIVSVDNSYSITFRNIRIHDVQPRIARAAVLLLGDASAGGHGRCNNIIWENLIVRNDVEQPGIALLAARGCGTHRFFAPDLENYVVLLEWQGGGIDLISPYAERAGRYAVNCNIDTTGDTDFLNTFGGTIGAAASGLGCAIRASTRNVNSYATLWGFEGPAAHVYELPEHPTNFHGVIPNLSGAGPSQFSGVAGWRRMVRFPDYRQTSSKSLRLDIPPRDRAAASIPVADALPGHTWARAVANFDLRGAILSAYVSALDTVTVVVQNPTGAPLILSGTFLVECGAV